MARKSRIVLGLNSGTSADGIDAVACEIQAPQERASTRAVLFGIDVVGMGLAIAGLSENRGRPRLALLDAHTVSVGASDIYAAVQVRGLAARPAASPLVEVKCAALV